MSLSRVCRRAIALFKSSHHLPLESRCIPNYNLSGGTTTSSVYQRHFGHDSMWRPKLGSFNKCGQHQPFAAQSLLRIQRLYSSQASTQEKSRKTLLYLTGLVFAMVAASYAAVPLYRRFCQATGYGGTIQRRESVEQKIARHAKDGTVATREIVVQFNADVADGMPWKFIPTQREVRVKPGESALAFYTAENQSSTPIVGVSTYNVTPMKAAVYFNKIQCFCFEEQRLLPGEQIDMPVFFYIDPEFETDPRMDVVKLPSSKERTHLQRSMSSNLSSAIVSLSKSQLPLQQSNGRY